MATKNLLSALNKLSLNSFPGHAGRPGARGGSLPRGAAGASREGYKHINDVIADLGIRTDTWNMAKKDIPIVWRSMSEYEYKNIQRTRRIQSSGGMSFPTQPNQTFYDVTPSRGYAEDNLNPALLPFIREKEPNFPAPTNKTKVYIVGVPNSDRFQWNRQGEFYTTAPLPASQIRYVIEGKQFGPRDVYYKVIKK